jgi:hypothetical protein
VSRPEARVDLIGFNVLRGDGVAALGMFFFFYIQGQSGGAVVFGVHAAINGGLFLELRKSWV